MKMQYHIIIVVIIWSTVLVDSRKIRGISLTYRRFYKEKKSFLCIDGSKIIPFEQVNDDYCDCLDGSDEPGTSACTNGRFYCINLGFRPHFIPSSRVNDGICDCCDGSDEYNSRMRCRSTCRDLGQRERAEAEDQIRALNQGLLLRQQLIAEGVSIWREKQSQLRDLQRVYEQLRSKLEAHRKRKRKAEGLMGLLKPPGDDSRKEQVPESPAEFFRELDCDKDGSITVDEVQANVVNRGEEGRGLTEQEALALLGGSRQADLSHFQETLWQSLRNDGRFKIKEDPGSEAGALDEDPNIKAAGNSSADLKKMEEAYDTVRMEIRDLEETLSTDYGADKEFMYLQSQCVELTVYEYTYVLCPFNQVTQKSSTGTEILLGKWGSWAGHAEGLYSKMLFDRGEPCWQGPTRSTQVALTCGTVTALRGVKEPSKCSYDMELRTPAACRPLQRKRKVHSEL
ncbi:glucosidase 2 subunit beta-like isoform X1 [Anguilla rostrata]|uniref:glucosidase 2 subunit beta-like isoform X1 n=1 Tax=Anguilla rostrata TaxID=7938 RepID=UPI0030CFEC4B